jgi:hypothetical protein
MIEILITAFDWIICAIGSFDFDSMSLGGNPSQRKSQSEDFQDFQKLPSF